MEIFRRYEHAADAVTVKEAFDKCVEFIKAETYPYTHLLFRIERIRDDDKKPRLSAVLREFPELGPYYSEKRGEYAFFEELSNCTPDMKPVSDTERFSIKHVSSFLERVFRLSAPSSAAVMMYATHECGKKIPGSDEAVLRFPDGRGNAIDLSFGAAPVSSVPSICVAKQKQSSRTVCVSLTGCLANDAFEKTDLEEREERFSKILPFIETSRCDYILMNAEECGFYTEMKKKYGDLRVSAKEAALHLKGSECRSYIRPENVLSRGGYTGAESIFRDVASKYGYSAVAASGGDVFRHRDENGHYTDVSFRNGVKRGIFDISASFFGLGFYCDVSPAPFLPADNGQLRSFAEAVFACLGYIRDEYFDGMLREYPPFPDWYEPPAR